MLYNVYCDETCHLEHDGINDMVIGAVWCPQNKLREINQRIKEIKSKTRVHLLLEEERYMVVLEERKGYFLLITAFYLDYDHALQKQLKHYKQYRSIQPSSSGQYFFSNPIDQSKEMDII